MAKIEIKGLEKLQKKLKENCTLNDVKTVIKQNGTEMQRNTGKNAVFTKGYSTGTTKRSIRGEIRKGGFEYAEGPTQNMHLMLNMVHVSWMRNLSLDLHIIDKCQSLNPI